MAPNLSWSCAEIEPTDAKFVSMEMPVFSDKIEDKFHLKKIKFQADLNFSPKGKVIKIYSLKVIIKGIPEDPIITVLKKPVSLRSWGIDLQQKSC